MICVGRVQVFVLEHRIFSGAHTNCIAFCFIFSRIQFWISMFAWYQLFAGYSRAPHFSSEDAAIPRKRKKIQV